MGTPSRRRCRTADVKMACTSSSYRETGPDGFRINARQNSKFVRLSGLTVRLESLTYSLECDCFSNDREQIAVGYSGGERRVKGGSEEWVKSKSVAISYDGSWP